MLYKQLENKNFLNNQHYIINNKRKKSLIFDYVFKSKIWEFKFKLYNILLNFLFGKFLIPIYLKSKPIIFNIIFHLIIGIILIPLLFIHFLIYLLIFLYISYFTLSLIKHFLNSQIYILAKKRNTTNSYFKLSYNDSLIEYVKSKDNSLKMNYGLIFISLIYSSITSFIIYLIIWYAQYSYDI